MTISAGSDIVDAQNILGGNFLNGLITKIEAGSLAEELELKIGDKILKINGRAPRDIIDLSFLLAEEEIELLIEHDGGEREIIEFEKEIDTTPDETDVFVKPNVNFLGYLDDAHEDDLQLIVQCLLHDLRDRIHLEFVLGGFDMGLCDDRIAVALRYLR